MATLNEFSKQFEARMQQALKKATSKSVLTELKNLIVSDIKKRVTLGFGVEKNGENKYKFDRLSSSYVEQRKKYIKLGKNAKPVKSNLHQTGQMIEEDLDGIVTDNRVVIGLNTERSAKVAAFVSVRRPFLNMSKGEITRATKFIGAQLANFFKNAFNSL